MAFILRMILVLGVLICPIAGFCQQPKSEKKEKPASVILSLNGLNMVNDIYRLDLEGKKTGSHLSHILTGEFYNGTTGNTTIGSGDDRISGRGIGFYQKWVFSKKMYGEIPYICYGATFRDITINYDDEGYNTFVENSLEYYRYGKFSDQIKIKGALYNLTGGIQFVTRERIVLDAYLGLGYKKSSSTSNYPGYRSYTKYESSHAYNGWITQVGFKIGVKFY
jgi:hypothetical protein